MVDRRGLAPCLRFTQGDPSVVSCRSQPTTIKHFHRHPPLSITEPPALCRLFSMRVWFNRHFPLVYRVLRLLREGDVERRLTLLCSHRHRFFTGFAAADEQAIEPRGLSRQDYVQWCLDFSLTHRVDVFVPHHRVHAIVAAKDEFARHGIRVLHVADAATLPRLHHKGWVYREAKGLVPLAESSVIHHAAELPDALEKLWSQGLHACIKPAVSIYGKGFYRLHKPHEAHRKRHLSARDWAARHAPKGACPPQLVLEYLPGHEFSVDCIGDAGRFVTGVVRKKSMLSDTQVLDRHPTLLGHAARLIERFRLTGLVNIQFKEDSRGQAKLLEINPRPSGGVAMACLSGINLPYLALCGELNGYATLTIPEARLGLRVTEVSLPVILPHV